MYGIATVVFREIIEIALVLGIVLAATRGLPKRGLLVSAGLAVGVIGSFIVFLFTDTIADSIDGMGQEVFNACIMFTAVGFLSWTVIWMKRHGRELAQHINAVGAEVVAGRKSLFVIVFVVALATLREGAEIVLFTYSQSLIGVPATSIALGGLIGFVGGAAVGLMLYMGLLKTVKRHLFTVTSWMLIILTAGMAAQGASFLIQADMLPMLSAQVWDTSAVLDGGSFLGETMGVLFGYNARPTGMELVFYVSVLLIVGAAYKFIGTVKPKTVTAKAEEQAEAVPAE